MSRRFLITLISAILIIIGATVAIFLAKGYRFSPQNGSILGTGILSITSIPDQASVFLDGHLTTATNANINSLIPKKYKVKIEKDGFIAWEKEVEVRQGLVTEIEATLFRSIPSVYPLTYSGIENPTLSKDGDKLVYVVPEATAAAAPAVKKKSGLWVWEMSERAITFARSGEPRQIAISQFGTDFSQANLRFSPNSNQVLATFPDRSYLLETNRLNDSPRDVTPTVELILKEWEEDQKTKDQARLALIKDRTLRKEASSAATLKWAPDETKFIFSTKDSYKSVDMISNKSYDLPKANHYFWLPNKDQSQHVVLVEYQDSESKVESQSKIRPAKISIVEFDGSNKSEIFAGNFNPELVFAWPDGSRLMIVSSLPIITASKPNLFGVNLK